MQKKRTVWLDGERQHSKKIQHHLSLNKMHSKRSIKLPSASTASGATWSDVCHCMVVFMVSAERNRCRTDSQTEPPRCCLPPDSSIRSFLFFGKMDECLDFWQHFPPLSKTNYERVPVAQPQLARGGSWEAEEESAGVVVWIWFERARVWPCWGSVLRGWDFLFPVDSDVELSATSSAPCVPACYHASHIDNTALNLWNYASPS